MHSENQSGMQCVECEGLLAEAIDGVLHGSTLATFEAHRQSCAACRAMVEEATAGMHWLKGLDEVEPPRHLVHNILTQTIGALPSEHAIISPQGDGWLDRLKGRLAPIYAPVATPRFAMSFGMAFFSITMLLSIAGLHISDLRRLDLSSKGIAKTYASTQARVLRYYDNIRLVYEIESRVRDLRRVATPEKQQEEPTPKNQPKSDNRQDKDRRNQNYSRDANQPELAASPVGNEQGMNELTKELTYQARLNRRTA
jgi:hypothetical protein